MRRNHIDNLRWMAILLLFPYHTFTLFNNWGERYYVRGEPAALPSLLVRFCQPWFMPLLFVLAGASAVYALEKRAPRTYLRERVSKLLVPLLAGLLLVVPSLTYFAERFHNGYTGGYFAQYRLFFSKSDLVGYGGGFTPAHLWFLAYLFVISLAALPLLLLRKKRAANHPPRPWPLPALAALFLPVWIASPVLDLNGKSVGRYFMLFLLGALFLSGDAARRTLEAHRKKLTALWLASSLLYLCAGGEGALHDGLFHLTSWMGILALMGQAGRHFDFRSPLSEYFARASFSIYIFHLPWIVAVAYFTFPAVKSVPAQIAVILSAAVPLTVLTYEAVRRVPVLRALFAVKKGRPHPKS